MKILYDHQAFDMQQYGGVSNCFTQLISNLPSSVSYDISLLECDNQHLKDSGVCDVKAMENPCSTFLFHKPFRGQARLYYLFSKLCPLRTSYGRNRLYSIEKLKSADFNVFHPTFFDPYFLPYLGGKPFVITVHDMIPELFFSPNDYQNKVKPILCKKASHIIAVSQKTRDDLIDILSIPRDKISVIYHGAPNWNQEPFLTPVVSGKYILYVGQRNLYKNFVLMLKSLTPCLFRHKDICLVCTGPNFTNAEIKIIKKFGLTDRVFHVFVNDLELHSLYQHALCFIYPSLYEGFGIPILEAYSANCPVLLNRKSCFPEIAEEAAVYFCLDEKHSDLYEVMENFLEMSDKEHDELIAKQKRRLSFFSWRKSAQQLAEIYYSII